MDSIFSKFGKFDFMGIWGPGAIAVTYFLFTLNQPLDDFMAFCGITNPDLSDTYLMILLYTAVAYTVGVIVHEFGRILANMFNLFLAENIHSKKAISEAPGKLHPLQRIQWNYQQKIEKTLPGNYKNKCFDEAITYLEYHTQFNTSQVDSYHSIYALARGLTLTFLFHAIVSFVAILLDYSISPLYFLFDGLLAVLFFFRTYRYYYFWLESVFTHYYYCTKDSDKQAAPVSSPSKQ